jgi:hypothetical protein
MNIKGAVPFTPVIERARMPDLVGIRWLLDMEALPSVDITEDALGHFLVCRDETGVAGVVGLERYGELALLRSLVVTSEHMGFRCIGREEGPPAIQSTREFTSLCPATAVLMVKP